MAAGLKLLDAYVEVHADASKVGDDAARQIEGSSGGLMGAGKRIGTKFAGAIAGAFAVEKVGEFIGDSISEASDLNETISASQQIFGASAGAISAWGDTAATAMGLSKQEAIESATQFGNMFQQLGIGNAKATDMSKSMVQMAADFGSFNNLPTSDVLESISGAMRGEYDSLQRIIPNISAARVEQEALNETHKKHASSLTAAEKAQATMNILLKDGKTMTGDFARTSSGYANQQKIAAAQTENLKAQIGAGFLPIVKDLSNVFTTSILPALAGFASWVGKNSAIITPLVVVLGAVVAILTIWIGVQAALNLVMALNPIGLIVIAIGLLIGAIVLLVMNWGRVVSFLSSVFGPMINWVVAVWNGLVARFQTGGAQIAGAFQAFIGWVVAVWNGIIGRFQVGAAQIVGFIGAAVAWIGNRWVTFWNGMATVGRAVLAVIVAYVTNYINGVRNVITTVMNAVRGAWNGAWNGLRSVVQTVGNGVLGVVRGILSAIGRVIGGFGGTLYNAGRSLITGFINGIRAMIGNVVGVVRGLMDRVAAFFPHSPAKEGPFSGKGWTPYSGRATVEGFAEGINAGIPSVRRSAGNMMAAAATGPASFGSLTPGGAGAVAGGAGSSPAGGDVHNYYVTIDGRTVDSFTKVVDVFDNLKQGARQGAGTTMAVGA